jgi:ADP-ribose pyrophosphatase YjhB (NUDIX family)
LRHRAVHVLVFDGTGRLFLQKRSARKDTAPGLWDTSVGGHMQPGEQPEQAAQREFSEELGCTPGPLTPAYCYEWSTTYETELIIAFACRHQGPFQLQVAEIDDGRFWSDTEIELPASAAAFSHPSSNRNTRACGRGGTNTSANYHPPVMNDQCPQPTRKEHRRDRQRRGWIHHSLSAGYAATT